MRRKNQNLKRVASTNPQPQRNNTSRWLKEGYPSKAAYEKEMKALANDFFGLNKKENKNEFKRPYNTDF